MNLTLNCCGPVVTGWTDNDRHFLEMFFEVWAWVHLVPRNTSNKTGSGTKYKWFSGHPHRVWHKLTNHRFNRSICQEYCSTTIYNPRLARMLLAIKTRTFQHVTFMQWIKGSLGSLNTKHLTDCIRSGWTNTIGTYSMRLNSSTKQWIVCLWKYALWLVIHDRWAIVLIQTAVSRNIN